MDLVREVHTYTCEAEWLAMRSADLTSTEAAALFGVSPYATEYELHHIKAGLLTPTFTPNERMVWGNRLESAIAHGIAEDYGLLIEPMKVYARIPALRMGSSFDYKIVGLADGFYQNESARDMFRQHGPAVLEIKNVDGLVFRRNWIEDGDTIEAPPHIEFQVQHQLEVADLGWSMLAPLVGGNTPKVVIRERDREIGALIRQRAELFWSRVEAGISPEPDYARDGDTIGKLLVQDDGSTVDLSDNPRVAELCHLYKAAGVDEKAAKERKATAKAELMHIIDAAKIARVGEYKISAGTRKETYRSYVREAGERVTISITQIPAAQIESVSAPYRDFRITGGPV